jgi:hypothetical protein
MYAQSVKEAVRAKSSHDFGTKLKIVKVQTLMFPGAVKSSLK